MVASNKRDQSVQQVLTTLKHLYAARHPRAKIQAYRLNPSCIRVRILDPDFAGIEIPDREETVWRALDELPEQVANQISFLLPLTPEEGKNSGASIEFDQSAPNGRAK